MCKRIHTYTYIAGVECFNAPETRTIHRFDTGNEEREHIMSIKRTRNAIQLPEYGIRNTEYIRTFLVGVCVYICSSYSHSVYSVQRTAGTQ